MQITFEMGALVCLLAAGCGGGSGTSAPPPLSPSTPTVTVTPSSANITTAQPLAITITVSGSSGTPTGSVSLSSGSYTSAAATLTNGDASVSVPAGSLVAGSDTLTVTYKPDAAGSQNYKSATGTASVTITAPSTQVPTVTVVPALSSITTAQALAVAVTVAGSSGTPTGSVVLSSGSYTSNAATLSNGSASITISVGSLATGNDTLTVGYTPNVASSAIYKSATGTASVTVTVPTGANTYKLTVNSQAPSSGVPISVSPVDNDGSSNGTTSFTRIYNSGAQVMLTAPLSYSSYSFVSWSGCTSNPSASICDVTMNSATTVTASYNEPGITSITVTPKTATIGAQAQFAVAVQGTGSFSKSVSWAVSAPAGSSLSPGDITASGLYTTSYPAPPTVTVTATSTQDTTKSGSVTVTLNEPAAATGPDLTVDAGNKTHAISPLIYGINGYLLDSATVQTIHPGIVRWGGDDVSRYNYKANITNSASDYYFENFSGAGFMFGGGNFTGLVTSASSAATETLGTVPVLGWVANSTTGACSFNIATFPGQTSSTGNCGSGVYTDGSGGCVSAGGCDIYGNSTIAAITSISEPPPDITASTTPATGSVTNVWATSTWSGSWVNSILSAYGPANPATGTGKAAAIWDLDNEPTWWDAVHRDVHPNPFTYDEVTNNGVGTALAIKTADPTAQVSGPVIDYWWAYFYSKKDIENGWSNGAPCYEPWSAPIDRQAHNGTPMIEYYLQQFNKYSQSYGIRLLDYVDIHAYFAPDNAGLAPAGDTALQQARLNGTRVFWDPTYTDPNYSQPNYLTDPNYTASCSLPLQAPNLINTLKTWVSKDYPGTKTAIDEYNFGGLESINGAVTQADILGIFGREGLDLGALWPTGANQQSDSVTQGPANFAFAMYRNYDGNSSTFGDMALASTSTTGSNTDGEGQLAVYGAQRSSDNAITIVVVNKTYGSLTSTLSLANFSTTSSTAQAWLYSGANLNAIVAQPAVSLTAPVSGSTTSTITSTFPAQSITLLVVPN